MSPLNFHLVGVAGLEKVRIVDGSAIGLIGQVDRISCFVGVEIDGLLAIAGDVDRLLIV